MSIISRFWKSIIFIAGLIGLIFIPADILDIPDALTEWNRVFSMIDQNTALWVFVMAALIYIVWIDARPLLYDLRYKRHRPLDVAKHIIWISVPVPSPEGTPRFVNIAFIRVMNVSKSQSTVDGISIVAHVPFEHFRLATRDGLTSVSLNHGETADFRLLSFYGATCLGLPTPGYDLNLEDEVTEGSEINLRNGHHSLRFEGKFGFMIPKTAFGEISNLNDLLHLRLSARNQSGEIIELAWKPEKLVREGDYFDSPISISGVTKA